MKRLRTIQFLLLIIGICLGLLIGSLLWKDTKQGIKAIQDPQPIELHENLEWITSKVILIGKINPIDDTGDYLLEFELPNQKEHHFLAVNPIEYRIAKVGQKLTVQYLNSRNKNEITHLQWFRSASGKLDFTYDKPLVVLDAGHGGLEKGEGNSDLFIEKDINLKMTLKMEELLSAAGIQVVLTRDSDETVSNLVRAELSNYLKPKLVISNHINKYNAKTSGIEVHYSQKSDKDFAEDLANALASEELKVLRVINRRGDTPELDYYFMHKYIDSPSYIIEYGFADFENDAVYLHHHWESLVEKASNAIIDYLLSSSESS